MLQYDDQKEHFLIFLCHISGKKVKTKITNYCFGEMKLRTYFQKQKCYFWTTLGTFEDIIRYSVCMLSLR